MLKQQLVLEVVKGERTYQLHLPQGCPLGEINDVLYEYRTFIMQKMQEALKVDEPKQDAPASDAVQVDPMAGLPQPIIQG